VEPAGINAPTVLHWDVQTASSWTALE